MSKNALIPPEKIYRRLAEILKEAGELTDSDNLHFNLPNLRGWAKKHTLRLEVERIEKERAESHDRE